MWLGNENFCQLSNTSPSFLRLVCKSLQHHPQPFIQASAMLSHVYPQLKACAHYGGVFLLLFWELDQPMLYISEHMRWSKSLPEGMTRPIGINGLRLVSVFFTWERERGEKSLLTDICFFLVGSFCGCGGYDCEWCTHESIRWYVPSPPLLILHPSPNKSHPPQVIKQRMQVHQSEFRSAFTCARKVYTTEGLSAFYISYPTTLTMTVPFTAVQFTVYEQLKLLLNPSNSYSPLTHILSGGLAGAVGAAVTTPLDVAKTILQTRGSSTDEEIRRVRGMGDAFRVIWKRDGIRGFGRGLTPRVLTFMPSNALCWLSYEFFSEWLFFFWLCGVCLLTLVMNRGRNTRVRGFFFTFWFIRIFWRGSFYYILYILPTTVFSHRICFNPSIHSPTSSCNHAYAGMTSC